ADRFLLLSLLLCLLPVCLSCPALCRCFSRRAEVVCDSTPFDSFPSDSLPQNTSILTIQFTNISTITETHLNRTPNLQELHLFSNQIQNLGPHLLRGLPKLRSLDLTDNKLTNLPANVFKNSTLTWLDLSGNRLTKIPGSLFGKLPNLDNLDLPNNRLEKVTERSLDALTKLERLNLNNNKINTLDSTLQTMAPGSPSLSNLKCGCGSV
uniref:LRRNT domain-containing protein n=1 Tax=Periophthalmus magnuspinnatus TaxID=409849 RepID=A0A3B4B674_9GOBI